MANNELEKKNAPAEIADDALTLVGGGKGSYAGGIAGRSVETLIVKTCDGVPEAKMPVGAITEE